MLTATQVKRLMTPSPITLTPQDTMASVRDVFEANHFHHLPVVEGDRLVGIISTREVIELVRNLSDRYEQIKNENILTSTLVKDVMNKEVVTIFPSQTIYDALKKFNTGYFHSLPVVEENDKLVGILTSTDLTRFLFEELKGERFLF
jgi:CBS domain-containing protein